MSFTTFPLEMVRVLKYRLLPYYCCCCEYYSIPRLYCTVTVLSPSCPVPIILGLQKIRYTVQYSIVCTVYRSIYLLTIIYGMLYLTQHIVMYGTLMSHDTHVA